MEYGIFVAITSELRGKWQNTTCSSPAAWECATQWAITLKRFTETVMVAAVAFEKTDIGRTVTGEMESKVIEESEQQASVAV